MQRVHDGAPMTEAIAAPKPVQPVYRGVSPVSSFFVALGAVPVLVVFAPSFRASVASAVYGAGLLTMFGCSVLFHRTNLSPGATRWLLRLDLSAIFLCIA